MSRKLPWFEIVLAVVVLSAYLYAALSDAYNLPNRWFIRDDAYYYFKVAQNISEGHGSTFDGIHPTNGYHPLWMLVCIPIFALARYDLILPLRLLVVVMGLLQVATAILLYRLLRSLISTPVAVLAAAYWAFASDILVFLYKTGVESGIALFFLVLALTLANAFESSWRKRKPGAWDLPLLAIIAALAVFSRLDQIFFAAVLGVWIVLRESPMRYLLSLDILGIVLSCLGAFLVRLGLPGYYSAASSAVIMLVIATAVKLPIFYAVGLYTEFSFWGSRSALLRAGAAVLGAGAIVAVIMLGGNALHLIPAFPRPVLVLDPLFTLACILLIRFAASLFDAPRQGLKARSPFEELRACWRQWLREGAVFYGILGGSLGLYMVWNKAAFGSFSPISGQIKRWWGTFLTSAYGGPARTFLSFFGLDRYGAFNAWPQLTKALADWTNPLLYPTRKKFGNPGLTWDRNFLIVLAILFIAIMLVLYWKRRQAGRIVLQASIVPLFVGSWLQILSYSATGYASPKEWYWLTEPLLLIILVAWLLQLAREELLSSGFAARVAILVAVGGVVLHGAASYWEDTLALYPYGKARRSAAYAEVVPFLEKNTEPGAVIGMTGGGNVGYFIHDRTIVNMDGLINSAEYFDDLKAGSGSDYLYGSGMRYIFANPAILKADPYRGQYAGRLETIASRGGKDLMRLLPGPSE